ncbi:MAG: hypothetical protein FD146_1868 [Anaerolineaceae bacterium]|nr:MAG: hypothetical protein FD146_1868 [Anaerolineaceae bacterium]
MDTIDIYYYIRDTLACLGVLIGIGGAVFLFVKKKTLPAILSLVGFLFLAVEPILDLVIWQWLSYQEAFDYEPLTTAYACISGPAMFLGAAFIALAFFLAFREPKLAPPPPPDDLPPAI